MVEKADPNRPDRLYVPRLPPSPPPPGPSALNIFSGYNWSDHFIRTATVTVLYAVTGVIAFRIFRRQGIPHSISHTRQELTLVAQPPRLASAASVKGGELGGVRREIHGDGILLKGWDKVKEALRVYDSGCIGSSHETKRKLIGDTFDSSGPMAGALTLFATAERGTRIGGSFVDKMLAEAAREIKTHGRFSRHYDYDALGTSFFKTSVDIEKAKGADELYVLKICAAYVGKEPEGQLATTLGAKRVLTGSTAIVEVSPAATAEEFAIDFEEIVRRLDPVLGTERVKGTEIAKGMLRVDDYGECRSTFELFNDGKLSVSISPRRVGSRFRHEYDSVREIDRWAVRESILMGPRSPYGPNNTMEAPEVGLHVRFVNEADRYDVSQHHLVTDLSERLMYALRGGMRPSDWRISRIN